MPYEVGFSFWCEMGEEIHCSWHMEKMVFGHCFSSLEWKRSNFVVYFLDFGMFGSYIWHSDEQFALKS